MTAVGEARAVRNRDVADGAPLTLDEIVRAGLCIGCGLCVAIAPEAAIAMVMTREGRERPVARQPLETAVLAEINAVCPGTRVDGPDPQWAAPGTFKDDVWGPVERVVIGHAADPKVRFRGSSGGVLTALGQFLLDSGRVRHILHAGASPAQALRSTPRLSSDRDAVLDGAGSRYAPVAILSGLREILERGESFALIGKPCDVTAMRALARRDPRVARLMRHALAFVCGGASDLSKSWHLLERFGVDEEEVALMRYRGHGNPGMNHVETRDGRVFEISYRQMWEDESRWMTPPRCRICPDAIGQSADIVASDAWLNGGPAVDDEGLNGIFVRTQAGRDLFDAAVAAGVLAIRRDSSLAEFDVLQSHQTRKRRAVWARLVGIRASGRPVPHVTRLALEDCARQNGLADNLAEARGARDRARSGRLGEPAPSESLLAMESVP